MPKSTASSRHLRWSSFESRILSGLPSVEPLEGTPAVHLIIEPGARRIGARFYSKEKFRVPTQLEEVLVRQVGVGNATALEITTGNEALFCDFYALCCLIADRVQIDGQSVSKAVTDTLASWAALVSRKYLIDENQQVGLIGELLFLTKAASFLGWETAAASWFGPNSEEHDFVLPVVDVEVKCTTQERRVHEIASLTQLLPKTGRPLFLVSVQLTASGESRDSMSLADMVAKVLASATRSTPEGADRIRQQLKRLRWSDGDAPHYVKRYSLRTVMQACLVSEDFPALVPATIAQRGAAFMARFERVSYSINVDGLGFPDTSQEFHRLFSGVQE